MNGSAEDPRIDHDLVWVVEDSAEDAEAIQRALGRTHPGLTLEFTDRGRESPSGCWKPPDDRGSSSWICTCPVSVEPRCSGRSAPCLN